MVAAISAKPSLTGSLRTYVWSLVIRSHEVFVDWRNGLGQTSHLRWSMKPAVLAGGRDELTLSYVKGSRLPDDVTEAIFQNVKAVMA